MNDTAPVAEPLLRTLSPLLRDLERKLRGCIDTERRYQFDLIRKAALEGAATDLKRKADDLDVERPLLVIMLMGGTGVGKSTLLNALAGASIAQASFQRPTTRDPVVYYHESIRPDRLDPALRTCRLQPHNREPLLHKIIVDTPDLDSNDLANRDTLRAVLPVADIVLYVGSQEKYHDQLGWELFREQRQRRAFAFVLNKWDRCLHGAVSGVRPDEDLLRDLRSEGFENPLLFRTSAQRWLDRNGQPHAELPEGEQFAQLVDWLERRLTTLEIEAVKARGVSQLLAQLERELHQVTPPELAGEAEKTREQWARLLDEKAEADTEVLLGTLDPHQSEIELHFSVQGQTRFWGLMRGYLKLFTTAKSAGNTLRDKLSFFPKRTTPEAPATPTSTWNVSSFTQQCLTEAGERFLDQRTRDLTARLQNSAVESNFPIHLLSKPCEDAGKLDWRQRYEQALREALTEAEQAWSKPTGPRRWLQAVLVQSANLLPNVVLIAGYLILMWRYFVGGYMPQMFDVLLPLILTLITMVLMQVTISLLLPMRWSSIRGEFRRQLERRLKTLLCETYLPIPGETADALRLERRQIEQLSADVRKVAEWLDERQQAASVRELYGSSLPASIGVHS